MQVWDLLHSAEDSLPGGGLAGASLDEAEFLALEQAAAAEGARCLSILDGS